MFSLYFKKRIYDRVNLISRARFLPFLLITYSMALVAANWFDSRLINVFGLQSGAGAFPFPLTFLLSVIITEVYGYKNARLAIWSGLFVNMLLLLYGQIVVHLPTPQNYDKGAFDIFLQSNMRIIFISAVCYMITEPCNSFIVAKLKILCTGKLMGIRFLIATVFSQALDILIFCVGAFYGVMSNRDLSVFMFTSWVFLVAVELLLLPVSVRIARKIKKLEETDIYDRATKFNIFSLDASYGGRANEFKK